MKTKSILINETEIYIISKDNEKLVAVRPICEALGIDYSSQLQKIKEDDFLTSVMVRSTTTGADGKEYKMNCLPLRFIFGWLFTINPNNVKPEIKEQILNYRTQCYNALFDTFTKRNLLLQEKTSYQIEIEALEEDLKNDDRYKKIQELKNSVKFTSQKLNSLDKNVVAEQLDLFKNKD